MYAAQTGSDLRVTCLAALSALSLAGDYLAQFGQSRLAPSAGNDSRVQHIAAHLRDSAHRPFDLEACIASLGRSQTDRLFRSAFGLSPKAYWTRHRLGLAQAMLTGTGLGIQAVADRLGLSGIYYFSRWFRQHACVTATPFRRLGREL